MPTHRLYLDTFFVQALLNRRDEHHERARTLLPMIQSASEVVVSEAVLTEIGNALSGGERSRAAAFIRRCYDEPNITVVTVDRPLLHRALELFESHADKEWA